MYRIFYFIISLLWSNILFAQSGDGNQSGVPYLGTANLLPKSPQAAELVKVNEISVNMARGIPDISFPLYIATVGDQKIPISIQYNAGGMRYDDVPTAVGLKWSLIAGGEVSRNINGRADETDYLQNQSTYTLDNLYKYSIYSDTGVSMLGEIHNNMVDPTHDEYSYSYLSQSGYIFNRKGKWWDCTQPFTNNISVNGSNSNLLGFTFTDPFGNKAVFGGTNVNDNYRETTTTELSGNGFDNPSVPPFGNTAFKISKIQTYTKEEALFSYIVNDYSTYKLTSQAYTIRKSPMDYTGTNAYLCNCGNSTFNNSYTSNHYVTLLVSEIDTPNETVKFHYSDDASLSVYQKRLDSIVVTSTYNNTFIKKICFTYGTYSLSNYLRLDKVYEMTKNGDSLLIAAFHYSSSSFSGLGALNRDVYGYYNDYSNPCLISSNDPDFIQSGHLVGNRNVGNAMTQGTIDTITYPTGGKSVFFYSCNKVNSIVGPGAKVDSIIYLDHNYSETGRVTYKYSNPQNGYSLSEYVNNITVNGDNPLCPSTTYNSEIDLGYPASIFFYQQIEMRRINIKTGEIQLVKEVYDLEPNGYTNYGPVLGTRIYYRSNNPNDILKIEKQIYEWAQLDTLSVDWIQPGRSFLPAEYYYMYGTYGYAQVTNTTTCNILYTGVGSYGPIMPRKALLKRVETQEFDQKDANTSLTKVISYGYNNYLQKISETTTNSDGIIDSTVYHYLYTSTTHPDIQTITDNNLYGLIDETTRYSNNDVALNKTRVQYGLQSNGLVLPVTLYLKKLTSDEYTKQVVTRYDDNGNIVESFDNNIAYSCIFRDYNNNEVVAYVNNGRYTECAYISFETNATGSWALPDNNRNTSSAITGRQSYNLAGSISKSGLTASNSYIVSYWSRNGSYTVSGENTATIIGKTINGWTYYQHTIKASSGTISISGNGAIDELRLYPSSAQMKTYTYDPLIGITSHCDVRNTIVYYNYDDFGRVKDIRDQDGNILKTWNYHYINQ